MFDAEKTMNQCVEWIRSYFADKQDRVRIVMSRSIAEMFNCPEYGIDDLDNEPIDLGLSIGGDGTLLGVCRKLYTRKIPACGINIGRVGFLTDIELTELESRLDNLLNGEYQVVERTVIHRLYGLFPFSRRTNSKSKCSRTSHYANLSSYSGCQTDDNSR